MISIRSPQLADAPAIARCHIAAWRDSYRPAVADEILGRPSLEADYIAKWSERIRQPDGLVFVAASPSEIVGFIHGGRERTGRTDYAGEIYSIYVLAEQRGRGIGRQLFASLAQELLAAPLTSVIVWVFQENPCRHCYAAWGGELLETCPLKVGEQELMQVAYGWRDIRGIARQG